MTAINTKLAEDVKAIKTLIQAIFDAINAADAKALQAHFFPSANLTIIRQDPPLAPAGPAGASTAPAAPAARDGNAQEEAGGGEEKLTVVIRTSIEEFVRLIEDGQKKRKGRLPVLHEAPDLDATEVRVDALFGVAWSPFRVTFDGVLHHYGTMVYTLGRVDAGEGGKGKAGGGEKVWRVEGLTQNYRRTPGWSVDEVWGCTDDDDDDGAIQSAVWKHAPVLTSGRDRARRLFRSARVRVVLLIAAVVALGFGASALWTRVLSRVHLHHDLSWYGLGLHGLAPSVQYESFDARTPWLEFPRWDARCSQDYVFLGWRGHEVDEPGAVILDSEGGLVWRQTGSSIDQNDVKTQVYRGETFLTFQMDGPEGDQLQGAWYMMDESYTVRYRLRPHEFPHADMHEFHISGDDTALVITTIPVPYDLRSIGGPEHGWLEDCYFQELDVETGELLFQWSSAAHFPPNTTMEAQNNCLIDPNARFAGCGNDRDTPFDYYHLNSVEKDSLGNYLVSARNIWAISYIDGRTGDVLWTLGAGHVNDFADLTGGAATGFSWQHHARWVDEGRTLSFFDNHYHRVGDPRGESGGRVVALDVENRTAALRAAYNHPHHIRPESQGNMQHLDNGNYLVGWGSSGAFTEFAADGEVLCDARFGAEAFFEFSPVSSYRVFRGAWTGRPTYPPSVAIVGGKVFVSWNGATEVDRWQVEKIDGVGSGPGPGAGAGARSEGAAAVEVVAQQFRDGFETEIRLPKGTVGSMIRVVALDEGGEELGASDFLEVPGWNIWGLTPYSVIVLTSLGILATSLCGAVICWTCVWRRRRQMAGYEALDGQQGGWKLDEVPRPDAQHRLSGEMTLASPSRGGEGGGDGQTSRRDAYDT
ncbi:hypothetical protein VM1G_09870 [Cytospora mali]|uniref:Uncharacterized protein n=1 Tax=Cytospora mali TaxID=578113 RepID=A0A194WDZ5_CYTMA|nr:hypothetical protein VM1G_09870 [Valsa mali]